jgi:lactoylglutathione lyase
MSSGTLLELHVDDFGQVVEFYKVLGFEEVWRREPDEEKGYLVMRNGHNVLSFWCGNSSVFEHSFFAKLYKHSHRGVGVEIGIQVHNIDSLYQVFRNTEYVVEQLEMKPWGLRDFRLQDPFGYYVKVTEPHDIFNPKYAIQ